MKPGEYAVLEGAEEGHWWYLGLRDFLTRMIARHADGKPRRILDAGCGTGGNLRLLQGLYTPDYLGGFDVAEAALNSARVKAPGADVYQSSILDPEIRGAPLDLVISMDVVYMVGLRENMEGLRRLAGALRPGGLFILHLPAYNWMKSAHDVAIATKERYSKRDLDRLSNELGLETQWLGYRVWVWFPLVLLGRLPGMLVKPKLDEAHSDLALPPAPINAVLAKGLEWENSLITRGFRPPFGSSVALVACKR